MKSNAELKQLAWSRLWTDRWFGRLFGGGLLLSLCGYAVNSVIGGALAGLNVQSWGDYARAVALNRVQLTTPVPSLTPDYVSQATSATLFECFFSYIVAGIVAYGGAVILRRCLANEERGWLKAAFGGFGQPFGVCWLFFRQVVIFIGWTLMSALPLGLIIGFGQPLVSRLYPTGPLAATVAVMAVVLGGLLVMLGACVPFYRYRYLWLIKAENPDWGAGKCLKACRTLMRGKMMKSVRLDCAYWKPITLLLLLAVAFGISGTLATGDKAVWSAGLVCFASLCGVMAVSIMISQYISVGQAFLYQELKREAEAGCAGDAGDAT